MASFKQINANRQNGKKGGPKTPAGRAAVRYNALKHGLAAAHPVSLVLEDEDKFELYLQVLHSELQPVGIIETMLVDQIADAYWRRQRIIGLETGLFDVIKAETEKDVRIRFTKLTTEGFTHLIARHDVSNEGMLGRYYRYDAQFERSFFRAWKELKSLQAARRAESAKLPAQVEVTEGPLAESDEYTEQTQIEPQRKPPAPEIQPETPEKGENDNSIM